MPTDSEYGDDIRLLDDLTRLKLRLIDKKLHKGASPRVQRALTPDYERYTPPAHPERRRDRFHRKIDRRNELLQKLWEELGNGGSHRRYARSLPPLTPRPLTRHEHVPWMEENLQWNKTGNTKKDLMELMLIQNAQIQQWMMTQTLQRHQGGANSEENGTHHHYYDSAGRALPPIRRADAGSQYPQDFFNERTDAGTNSRDSREGRRNRDSRDGSPSKDKNKRKRQK